MMSMKSLAVAKLWRRQGENGDVRNWDIWNFDVSPWIGRSGRRRRLTRVNTKKQICWFLWRWGMR